MTLTSPLLPVNVVNKCYPTVTGCSIDQTHQLIEQITERTYSRHIMDDTTFCKFCYKSDHKLEFCFSTVPLTALVITRDVALIAAVFYVRYKTVPPPVSMNKNI